MFTVEKNKKCMFIENVADLFRYDATFWVYLL